MSPAPRISVVVPIYNVEGFLAPCLDSLVAQTVQDFEVVMVDDGSTDGSSAIAQEYARRDERFRLIVQANGGLSKARNTGIDAASGEYLAFLDSDDLLPEDAYELLLGSLEETGSDFATGNVQRYTRWGLAQVDFVARAFAETRLKTHITRDWPLLADRVAWNKLFRRSFWDAHALRFPEGRVHEDIPVMLPAHFLARSVDVLSDPVYLWRIREAGELSITERRADVRVLLDRLSAVEHVSDFLAEHGPAKAKRWYDESVLADDLRRHLDILDVADDEYRRVFIERAGTFMDRAGNEAGNSLVAIQRLKWHLVRRRLLPELLEVLRFQNERLDETPPVRIRGHWYGDYPFLDDPRRAIPRKVYQLDRELQLRAHLEDMRMEDGKLRLRGYSYIPGIGAPAPESQRITLVALRTGRFRRIRMRLTGVRLATRSTHRPDATARTRQALCDVSWSGFDATLDPDALRRAGRRSEGVWELHAFVRAGGVKRSRARFLLDGPRAFRPVQLPAPAELEAMVTAAPDEGAVTIDVRSRWATLRGHRLLDGGVLELTGDLSAPRAAKARLELRLGDAAPLSFPLATSEGAEPGAFRVEVPLDALRASGADAATAGDGATAEPADATSERADATWEVWVRPGGGPLPLRLPAEVQLGAWPTGSREVALLADRAGNATLAERDPRPVVTAARWEEGAILRLEGRLAAGTGLHDLAFAGQRGTERFAIARSGPEAGFAATLNLGSIPSLAGSRPLARGFWELVATTTGVDGAVREVPVTLDAALLDGLPVATVSDHMPFAFGVGGGQRAVLIVDRNLDPDERGQYHQRRLRATAYGGARSEPLREAVVYLSFQGRQYSDSPRAIHEALVRRGAPLEHLWVVRDGRCEVPAGTTVLREGSREYHEALARARYVVSNDHFPEFFTRRLDQTCLQTWHGTPLKRLGYDVAAKRSLTRRRSQRRWEHTIHNWQYVVSPNRFSTPILRRAYATEGEMLETGYPRVDILARPDGGALGLELRRRLGVPDGARTVLYAPTYRDHVRDRSGRYRLDMRLDLERLRAAVGEDTVILFRKHHYIADAVPATADGFVRDVSSYPDATQLLLAADILVTDYSSMMVDFANTGRPMLFYTYDLEAYRDDVRGFYVDFVETVPGPLLRTTDDLVEALRDIDAVRAAYAERYDAFAATFCELDDGRASERVVDRLFSAHAGIANTAHQPLA